MKKCCLYKSVDHPQQPPPLTLGLGGRAFGFSSLVQMHLGSLGFQGLTILQFIFLYFIFNLLIFIIMEKAKMFVCRVNKASEKKADGTPRDGHPVFLSVIAGYAPNRNMLSEEAAQFENISVEVGKTYHFSWSEGKQREFVASDGKKYSEPSINFQNLGEITSTAELAQLCQIWGAPELVEVKRTAVDAKASKSGVGTLTGSLTSEK